MSDLVLGRSGASSGVDAIRLSSFFIDGAQVRALLFRQFLYKLRSLHFLGLAI